MSSVVNPDFWSTVHLDSSDFISMNIIYSSKVAKCAGKL